MEKSKIITIRVPIKNYYKYLEKSTLEMKPLSRYIKDVLNNHHNIKKEEKKKLNLIRKLIFKLKIRLLMFALKFKK